MKKLKRNSFMQGAFIATFGIVLCKILGILYVIPFSAVIGESGLALYGYAYNIYNVFLSVSQAGIPLAMSKIISEYDTLGYIKTKERAYKLGKTIIFSFSLICFLILIIFAGDIGQLIIGNVTGGNTKSDVAFVIRIISTAILIVPLLSVTRGYLQGHKFIQSTATSQIIEQVVRVIIIVFGSFLLYKVLNTTLKLTVGVAVFAATLGGLASYAYLKYKERLHKKQDVLNDKKSKEPVITNKEIIKKIIIYATPLIMIDLFKSLYNTVDIVSLVKVLVNKMNYTAQAAESIMSVFSTTGLKINMIIIAFVSGMMTSLIPNLTSSLVQKDIKEVSNKINKTYQIILFCTVPMTVGLSILAKPVWTMFFGYTNQYGALTYRYFVFVALATAMFTSTITIVQVMKEYKMVLISLVSGMLVKVIFNIPFVYGFNKMGLPPFYGAITATILGYLVSSVISMIFLNKKYKISFEVTIKEIFNIVLAVLVMTLVLSGLKIVLPINNLSRITSILYIGIYAIIGAIIYITVTYFTKTIDAIFGKESIKNLKNKLFHKRGARK